MLEFENMATEIAAMSDHGWWFRTTDKLDVGANYTLFLDKSMVACRAYDEHLMFSCIKLPSTLKKGYPISIKKWSDLETKVRQDTEKAEAVRHRPVQSSGRRNRSGNAKLHPRNGRFGRRCS